MDSNTHSTSAPAGLGALAAAVDELADQGVGGLADGVLAERVMALRGLMDRLEGHWLGELADLDARGPPAPNTASRPPPPPPGSGTGST
jgi:hypothetical protein